nr:hypothetical protein BaRGS_012832 [Batillaria attramentaria]
MMSVWMLCWNLLDLVPRQEDVLAVVDDENGFDILQHAASGRLRLHRLYRMNIDGLFSIYDTTRYLLTTGIEQDINSLTDLGETPLHMLVSHVSYAGGNYVDPSRHHLTRSELQGDYSRKSNDPGGDAGLMAQFADFTDNLLRLLLSHGLDPNHTTARSSPFLRGGSGNALIEFVRLAELATTSRDFSLVLRWMRTLLQWGADPDIEPYQSEPIICHSQSSIFLKKQGTQPVSHYLHDARERQTTPASGSEDVGHGIQALLELFYNSMDHKALYDCLHAARGISRLHLHESLAVGMTPKDNFLSMLHCMAETPRSLKQIARVAVYKALDRQVAAKVDELPIPWAVKQYLLEFS